MQKIPFTALDEAMLLVDTEELPMSVHLEARVEGNLDEQRLGKAIIEAMNRHPLARARQAAWKSSDSQHYWLIPKAVAEAPLEVINCANDKEVEKVRSNLQSTLVPLDEVPFQVVLAKHPGGDYMMMNMNHTAADGVGTLRLSRSIIRAYAEIADPIPELDLEAVRRFDERDESLDFKDSIKRAKPFLSRLSDAVTPQSRIASDGETEKPGYDFELLRLSEQESRDLNILRDGGATINDILLAALHTTIDIWNSEHGETSKRIGVFMPVNMRPKDRWFEVVGNFSCGLSASSLPKDRKDFATVLASICKQTKGFKESETAGLLLDLLHDIPETKVWLRRSASALVPIVGEMVGDTSLLSNIGRLELEDFDTDGGKIKEFWFSPAAQKSLGVYAGAASLAGELFLTFRYHHGQFDRQAAKRFVESFHGVLTAAVTARRPVPTKN